MIRLERELREEKCLILLQEEMLWGQKSRIDWLRMGDGNTKFLRRRRNKIEALMDSEGRWAEGNENLKNMAIEFYTHMFKSDKQQMEDFNSGGFGNLEQEQIVTWEA